MVLFSPREIFILPHILPKIEKYVLRRERNTLLPSSELENVATSSLTKSLRRRLKSCCNYKCVVRLRGIQQSARFRRSRSRPASTRPRTMAILRRRFLVPRPRCVPFVSPRCSGRATWTPPKELWSLAFPRPRASCRWSWANSSSRRSGCRRSEVVQGRSSVSPGTRARRTCSRLGSLRSPIVSRSTAMENVRIERGF